MIKVFVDVGTLCDGFIFGPDGNAKYLLSSLAASLERLELKISKSVIGLFYEGIL